MSVPARFAVVLLLFLGLAVAVPPALAEDVAWPLRGGSQAQGVGTDAGLASPVLLVPEVQRLLDKASRSRMRENEAATAADMERGAVLAALVAYVGLRTNTPLCNDITSPDEHIHRLGLHMPSVLALLAGRQPGERLALVQEALRIEAALDLMARGDPLICKTGMNGSRYCPEGVKPADCDAGASPFPEFSSSSVLAQAREAARKRARAEVAALARDVPR